MISLYLENILKGWGEPNEGDSWWYPYLEKILKGGGDRSMKGGFIALRKPSSSLRKWSH
jgi:hypothetical protein